MRDLRPAPDGWESPRFLAVCVARSWFRQSSVNYNRIGKVDLQVPVWDEGHSGTPFLFSGSFPRGRDKFHPLEFVPSVELLDNEYPLILTTGRVLEHWHGGTMTRHSQLNSLDPQPKIPEFKACAVKIEPVGDDMTSQVLEAGTARGRY